MKTTIFKKLFMVYGLTIIIGFGVLALLLLQLFNQYFIDSKKALMLEQGSRISEEIISSLYTGQVDQERLTGDLQMLDNLLSARIWITDDSGIIVGVSGDSEQKYLGKSVESAEMSKLAAEGSYFAIGYFDDMLDNKSLTAGYPIFVGSDFRGGMFIHAPLTEIGRTFREIYRITVLSILFSCLVAYGILYFQIRKISQPLSQISHAAKEIAGGEFEKRLEIRTGDEIEELGNSFNHMAESLERIEEKRRNLIANISHDIRSPITSISGFAEGIVDGTIPPDKEHDYLCKILTESRRLMKITNNLLDLNNIQEGRMVPAIGTVDLSEAMRRAILSFERQITAKALNVTLRFDEEGIRIRTDPDMLERILLNLMDNAVKFTPEGGNIVASASESGDHVVVSVMNDGVSVSEEQLRMMWERFHKGDSSRGEDRNGFGLGLAIVREMISLLDEKIWVESGDGQIRFSFTMKKFDTAGDRR